MSLSRFRGSNRDKVDSWLLLSVLMLVGVGLIMISSASVVLSSEYFGSNYAYSSKQLLHFGIGLVALIVGVLVDYRLWQRLAPALLGVIILLLLATHIPGLAQTAQGAQRWIELGPIQFQPSELVKIFAILYFAAWLAAKGSHLSSLTRGLVPFITVLGVITLLIFAQPDAGTAMVILFTVTTMYFIAGAPWMHLFYAGILGGSLFGLLILSAPYRLQRFLVFLNPSEETLGAAYHINQALLAIGAGGMFGVGFGQSKQKFLYLPEPHTDSIFAITIEELGFLRAMLIVALLIFVMLRGYQIARVVQDPFGRYVAVGITSLIAIQTFINIGAMLGLMPLTGVTLPFISYGGSSLISLLFGVGILLNISRQAVLIPKGMH
ncbi:putative lipid II flippase FtsW [Candidatus Berkelbacteria bacterium]|nr:putative lipid II flippase FtsW [Candidatus Berkelbacteria bacterium]